jgi:CubicO group peptidase (beta-lactamase class C family)
VAFRPGTHFKYSNLGYFLLGYVIEKVSGMPYARYLERNIFAPLAMRNTGYWEGGSSPPLASGHLNWSIKDEMLHSAFGWDGAMGL